MAINEKYNYDDVFLRDLTLSVLSTLEDKIKWTNNFSSGPVDVNCKIYYSMTGGEDFLMDSFVDDIVSDNRKTELNTDKYPSGWITLTGWNIRSDEFANPNVWLRTIVENQEELRGILAKVRALPVTANYDLTILLNSEIDVFKASQSIMNMLWLWKYAYFEFNFMNIDCVIKIPDDQQIQINRDKSLSSDDAIRLTLPLEVQTYYPAFNENTITTPPYGADWFGHLRLIRQGALGNVQTDFTMEVVDRVLEFGVDNDVNIDVEILNPTSFSVTIYESRGGSIYEEKIDDRFQIGKQKLSISIADTSLFKTGIYFIKLTSDINQITDRFDIM